MEKNNPIPQTHRTMNRRSFLRLSGMLGLGVASAGVLPVSAEAVKFNRKTYKVSKTRLAMGTFVSMTIIHPSRDKAEEAMALAFDEVSRLTGLMSRFDQATGVAQLNREGYIRDLPPEVIEVVEKSLYCYQLSSGCFDISVKPVVDLFMQKFGDGKNTPPTNTELAHALTLIGSDKIELKGRNIRFKKPGMGITLDGIAKGYIVDKASKLLTGHKIENHLINAGGDIRTVGSKGDKKPWAVAVQDPKKKGHYPDVIRMTDGAIATSGNYEVYFDREKMFHHIVDPHTGLSPELSASVSVRANTATDADALSTSVFIMDPKKGTGFIDSNPGCECLVVARGGKIFKSAGWKSARA